MGALKSQVANTWPKITARYGYAMVTNGKEPENPYDLLVAATFEKAMTYVFAESPIRNAEARSSTLLCSTRIFLSTNIYNPPLSVLIFSHGRIAVTKHSLALVS